MLKIGLRYEECVVVTVGETSFRILIEKRSGGQIGFVTDAPREVSIVRQSLLDRREEFKPRTKERILETIKSSINNGRLGEQVERSGLNLQLN